MDGSRLQLSFPRLLLLLLLTTGLTTVPTVLVFLSVFRVLTELQLDSLDRGFLSVRSLQPPHLSTVNTIRSDMQPLVRADPGLDK